MIGTDELSTLAPERDYQPCRAESAECGCPDDCERDHGNE